jgi:SAM-dependent methyltransferase
VASEPTHSTDAAWRAWGEQDPYFGVITQPKFRRKNLTPDTLDEFFRSGQKHVDHVMVKCRQFIDPAFRPKRVLDFGCGVGRLLPALAAQAGPTGQVLGLDISDAMLAEARSNCDRLGVKNVTLARSDDELSEAEGDFDLVHSAIVLQHIEPARGRGLFAQLVARIQPGGIGALHLTYAKAAFADRYGAPPPAAPAPPPAQPRPVRGVLGGLLGSRWSPPLQQQAQARDADPEMQMNIYPMNDVLFVVQRAGVKRIHAEYTDHGGELGMMLYFSRPAA